MSQNKHMSQSKRVEASEAEIAVHWQEEAYVHPPEKFIAQANLTDPKVFDRFSLKKFSGLLQRIRQSSRLV
jgi:acetyl-CoA synthetase